MKIPNMNGKNLQYLLNDLRNVNEIFRKDVNFDNIKSHIKPSLRSHEDTFFCNTRGARGQGSLKYYVFKALEHTSLGKISSQKSNNFLKISLLPPSACFRRQKCPLQTHLYLTIT